MDRTTDIVELSAQQLEQVAGAADGFIHLISVQHTIDDDAADLYERYLQAIAQQKPWKPHK